MISFDVYHRLDGNAHSHSHSLLLRCVAEGVLCLCLWALHHRLAKDSEKRKSLAWLNTYLCTRCFPLLFQLIVTATFWSRCYYLSRLLSRFRNFQVLIQDHTAIKWQDQGSDIDVSGANSYFLSAWILILSRMWGSTLRTASPAGPAVCH